MAHGTAPGTRHPAPGTDTLHLRATRAFRRGILLAAGVLILLQGALFLLLWRIGTFVDPGDDPRAAAAFVALGTAVTLQAMAMVGVLWVAVATAWTTLRADALGWSLEHPWRNWQGRPAEIARAWRHGGWLVFQLDGQWRRWYVRARRGDPAVDVLRAHLREGAWLEAADVRRHLARTVLPAMLAAALLGGLALMWMMQTLDGLMHRP